MATQESLDRVQQLYVAYYGRPADQEGQEYWADRLDAEGEGAIINAFGNSEEYAAKAEGQGNATLINAIYLQAFSRGADPEGLAYYAGVLERGEKTLAEIATTIINAAGGIDAQTFNARVEAAAAYTAEFGAAADYDLEAAVAAVEAAKPGVNPSALTEALTTLKTAQDARGDFLEEAYEGNKFVKAAADTAAGSGNEPTADQIADAINNGTTGEYFDASTLVNNQLANFSADVSSFAGRADAVQDAAIEEGVAKAEKSISDYEKAIAAVDGLALAIRNYNRADDAKDAATVQLAVATAEANGQIGTFDATDNDASNTNVVNSGTTIVDATAVQATIDSTAVDIMTVNARGEFVIAAEYTDLAGITELRDDLQAQRDAQVADNNATTNLNSATTALNNLYSNATIDSNSLVFGATDGVAVATELDSRQTSLEDLNKAIERFEAARSLDDELESVNDNVEDALVAIVDEDDGLGVDVWTAADSTTTIDVDGVSAASTAAGGTADIDDDVILYSEDFADFTVANFGGTGEDRIYFGEGFSLVELSEAWDPTESVGNSATQEIFWEELSGNLTLYVENEAFAGNASTAGDITQITLTGVSAADIEFSNGYLTAGEPA